MREKTRKDLKKLRHLTLKGRQWRKIWLITDIMLIALLIWMNIMIPPFSKFSILVIGYIIGFFIASLIDHNIFNRLENREDERYKQYREFIDNIDEAIEKIKVENKAKNKKGRPNCALIKAIKERNEN